MKKIVTWTLLVAMLLSLALLPAAAATGSEPGGLTFDDTYRYQTVDLLSDDPHTFSAWVRIPKNLDYTVILFGNYTLNTEGYVNFEVQYTGYPKISYTGADGQTYSITFNQVDVRTGEWIYLTLVHDPFEGEHRCYVNGTLQQRLAGVVDYKDTVLMNPFLLGGDFRPANIRYLRGEIKQTSIFSTPRSQAEIVEDYRNGVSPTDSDLIAYYDVDALDNGMDIPDLTGNGNDLDCITVWLEKEDMKDLGDYAYTFAFVGDTQSLARYHANDFHLLYDWILENKNTEKIEYVFGLGDITDQNTTAEWELTTENIFRLNGVIPHSHIRGNHDGVAQYKSYMNNAAYTSQFEGFYAAGDWTNSWRTFDVGTDKYLLITFDYTPAPEVIEWACGIVEAHPDRKVIITTHRYMDHKQDLTHADLWNNLCYKYENVFLIVNGHHGKNENIVWRQDEGMHGNTVTQVLIDPQEIDKYADPAVGMVALFHFYEDGSRIEIEYYSTVRGAYYKDINQFTIWLTEPPIEGGEDSSEEESSEETSDDPSGEESSSVESNTTDPNAGTTSPDTVAGATADDSNDEGCASVASAGVVSLILAIGAAFVSLKKKD